MAHVNLNKKKTLNQTKKLSGSSGKPDGIRTLKCQIKPTKIMYVEVCELSIQT